MIPVVRSGKDHTAAFAALRSHCREHKWKVTGNYKA